MRWWLWIFVDRSIGESPGFLYRETLKNSCEVNIMTTLSMILRLGILGCSWLVAASLCRGEARAQSPDIEAAKKEGSVVVYGTVVPQSMQINAGFEKKYGIRVE